MTVLSPPRHLLKGGQLIGVEELGPDCALGVQTSLSLAIANKHVLREAGRHEIGQNASSQ